MKEREDTLTVTEINEQITIEKKKHEAFKKKQDIAQEATKKQYKKIRDLYDKKEEARVESRSEIARTKKLDEDEIKRRVNQEVGVQLELIKEAKSYKYDMHRAMKRILDKDTINRIYEEKRKGDYPPVL